MATLVAILVCSTDACEICLLSCAWFQTLARRSDQCVECILTDVCVYDVELVSDIFRFRYIGIDIYIYVHWNGTPPLPLKTRGSGCCSDVAEGFKQHSSRSGPKAGKGSGTPGWLLGRCNRFTRSWCRFHRNRKNVASFLNSLEVQVKLSQAAKIC